MDIISIIVFIVGLVGIIAVSYWNVYSHKKKEKSKISFKESLELVELPIVTFKSGGKKLHFLLDTGSNISYINKEVLSEVDAESLDSTSTTIGVGGAGTEVSHYLIKISYKDESFVEEFGAIDLSDAFAAIEAESHIKLHGILGNKFFEKYKYILDFKDLIAYR